MGQNKKSSERNHFITFFHMLIHYGVLQFGALSLAIVILFPLISAGVASWISMTGLQGLHISVQAIDIVTGTGCLSAVTIAFLFNLRSVIYFDRTGRSYSADRKYKRDFGSLLDYFADADPHRLNVEAFPEASWQDPKVDGIILGHCEETLIHRPTEVPGNVGLFGLPGSGKTTCQVIPTALRFGGSNLVIDIKGDILAYTGSVRKIRIFNPADPIHSLHYDPFAGVRRLSVQERVTFIDKIGHILVEEDPKGDGKYFSDGGRDFWSGISLYLFHLNPDITFGEVVERILRGNAFDWVTEVIQSDCAESKAFLSSYFGTNEKNVAGCYNSIVRAVRPFSTGEIASLLDGDGDCIKPSDLENGYDIYLEIPQDKIEVYSPVITIIVQQMMDFFMMRPDSSSGAALRPILLLLDEFPQLRFEFNQISAALSTLRSKKVTIFMAQQSIAQIEKRYGENGCREIVDCCSILSLFSAQDPRSRKYFSDLVGTQKVLKISNSDSPKDHSRSVQEARDLIFQPEDLGDLGGKVLIIFNGKYVLADRCACYD